MEKLAKEFGLTTGSSYWHFKDRNDLLEAILSEWAERAIEVVIARAEAVGADPQARMQRLIEMASDGLDAELELALRSWARGDSSVAKAVNEVGARRLSHLRRLLRAAKSDAVEAESRAFPICSILFGDALLPHVHGRLSRKSALRAAIKLVVSVARK